MASGDEFIPVLDLKPQYAAVKLNIQDAVDRVLDSGQFVMGPEVQAFERETALYLNTRYAISVNSGTDALFISLRALGIGPGDEVITTPFTFFATAEAISHVGATPVFVDIDRRTFNIDSELIAEKITPRTKAILPVHLFGQAADMAPILSLARKYDIMILEDVAQAFGGKYQGQKLGTIGDVGAFSFFPSKNLGACGDGGLIATNDTAVAELARMLRVHGAKEKYRNEVVGYNSRLDELQAAILRVKLPYIDQWNAQRRRVAARYNELLKDLPDIVTPVEAAYSEHVYHQYTVRILNDKRNQVQEWLAEAGIGAMVYYPISVHELPVYKDVHYSLARSCEAASEVLSLPIWPQLSPSAQERIVKACERFYGGLQSG
jgi:dTDP-4-amino-4,6-dideoxygalactose transaminase